MKPPSDLEAREDQLRALIIASLLAMSFSSAQAAQQCRDANGKFIKCPATTATATKCRDIKTKKFAKCGTPGTEPVPPK